MSPRNGAVLALGLLLILGVGFIFHQAGVVTELNTQRAVPYRHSVVSATTKVNNVWKSIFDDVSVDRIRTIVKDLSELYPQRVWYPLDRKPSDPLAGAWEYIDEAMRNATDNHIAFDRETVEETLVGVLHGTTDNRAPIIIAGTIASRYTAGANGFGASAAAVVETARLLYQYPLTNDVMFVLTNTITTGYGSGSSGNLGLRTFMNQLIDEGRRPAAIFWFSTLLHHEASSPAGLLFVSNYHDSGFQNVDFMGEVAVRASYLAGARFTTKSPAPAGGWTRTGAYDGTNAGVPSFVLSQPYYYVPTDDDNWNNARYDYAQAAEAVGLVASLTWMLGNFGTGREIAFAGQMSIGTNYTEAGTMPLTGVSRLTLALGWTSGTQLAAHIVDPQGNDIGQGTSNSGSLVITADIQAPGIYTFQVTNTGNASAIVDYSFSQYHDFDMDSLDDGTEYLFKSDAISPDTDADNLTDDQEYELRTNPRSPDTDGDGASDYVEVMIGSNPWLVDTDGDSLKDGFEIEHGLSPLSTDTDGDGVDDATELEMGLDPLNDDTDGDGLIDSLEIEHNTSALVADTDGDGLTDLFEVLNGLDPLSNDTDGDGLTDLYEVENGLLPFNNDTDGDSIPDGEDWDPKIPWTQEIPTWVALGVTVLVGIWLAVKKIRYNRGG